MPDAENGDVLMPKAVALLSGGVDSMLAIAMIKQQGVAIEAVHFQTMFGCCKDDARQAAHLLGVPCTLLKVGDDYLEMVEKPKYGYGRGVNPCVDCRSYMFKLGKKFMEQTGADFLISGEVLDQRPMSQKKRDFERIEAECGLEGKILRPLSAQRLKPTEAEEKGWVDREKLFAVQGRSRKFLFEMARKYGIEEPPSPSAGCALTSPDFAKKVRDVFEHHPDYSRWEFEILKMGRHFRLDEKTKLVIARNENQNAYLEMLHPEKTFLLTCLNFGGPHALLIGEGSGENFDLAGKLMLRYAQKPFPAECEIQREGGGETGTFTISAQADEEQINLLRIV